MNVGMILGHRYTRRNRGVHRLGTFDRVRRLRHVGLRRLFEHVLEYCNIRACGDLLYAREKREGVATAVLRVAGYAYASGSGISRAGISAGGRR